MKIAIIGAGFTGLAAAIKLAGDGHQVTIYEKDNLPGGLAVGFKSPGWEWPLEKHYHHIFTSDTAIRQLADKIGHSIDFYAPTTSIYYLSDIRQFDSPATLLKYPYLRWVDKIRTALGLAFLVINPIWRPLEKLTSESFIKIVMGLRSWQVLWQPLFDGKFGPYADKISAAWFWARIHKRSRMLGYPRGGFTALAQSALDYAQKQGAVFHFNTAVNSATPKKGQWEIVTGKNTKSTFDKVICTLPTPAFIALFPHLPDDYQRSLSQLNGIGAVNLVLSLKKSLFPDGTYWLNINDRSLPFLAVVEHTNFITSSHYGGQNLLYIGNYLPVGHKYFQYSAAQLINEFTPYLARLNFDFTKSWIKSSWVWTAQFAQPIVTKNYSRLIPGLRTPLANLYLANIQQVYPWDRGTNYAVELGNKVAQICLQT